MRPCTKVFLALALLVAGIAPAQEHRTFRIPFRTVNGMMMLIDAEVNDTPAKLLLDTGASYTVMPSTRESVGLETRSGS